MREVTVFGVEKPFPWALIGIYAGIGVLGLAGGGGLVFAALTLGIPTGIKP